LTDQLFRHGVRYKRRHRPIWLKRYLRRSVRPLVRLRDNQGYSERCYAADFRISRPDAYNGSDRTRTLVNISNVAVSRRNWTRLTNVWHCVSRQPCK